LKTEMLDGFRFALLIPRTLLLARLQTPDHALTLVNSASSSAFDRPLRASLLTRMAHAVSGFSSAAAGGRERDIDATAVGGVAFPADQPALCQLIDHGGRRCGFNADAVRQVHLREPVAANNCQRC